MLLTIITALIFTLSLIFIIVDRHGDSLLNLISWVSTISGFVLLIMISVITVRQIRSYDEYKQAVSEREVIVASLEEATSPEYLTTDIIKFNNKVISAKQWSGIWFGWFVNERLTTLDEIDIKDHITPKE